VETTNLRQENIDDNTVIKNPSILSNISTIDLKVVLGPVIGSVTTKAARVLVEFSQATQGGEEFLGDNTEVFSVTATLISDKNNHSCTNSVRMNVATVFNFNGLTAETKYKFKVEGVKHIESNFKTYAENLTESNFKIAVCGCNDVLFNKDLGENSLYNHVAERAKNGEINLVLHNGDQVYIDHKEKKDKKEGDPDHTNIYDDCLKLIKDKEKSEWEGFRNKIISKMKNLYRRTWSGKVAELMANCSNIMQFDDHEIHNDFGYNNKFLDERDPQSFVAVCARRVYYEYQRQLREDVDYVSFKNVTCDYHSHVVNNVGIFFLDHRGARSWYKRDIEEYLGAPQKNDLKDCLNKKFADCQVVIILSQDPLVLWNEELSLSAEKTDEMFIHLDKKNFEAFINSLADHRQSHKSQEMILVGGDIHIGGFTDIFRDGKPVFRQIISSGVGQRTKDSLITFHDDLMAQKEFNLGAGFTFKHHDWTYHRNYATMEMKVVNKVPIIESYLMISDKDIKPTKQAVVSNMK